MLGGLIVTTNTYLIFELMNNIEIGICEGLRKTLLLTWYIINITYNVRNIINLCVHQFLHPSGFDNKIRNCIEILNLNLTNQTAPIVCKSFFYNPWKT